MKLTFYKYQGTGNDFVLIDDRDERFIDIGKEEIQFLCDRKLGIGADGLMFLRNERDHDFRMVYYNADGGESTMCGNGGRCIAAFAELLGIIKNKALFMAIDGPHEAIVNGGFHVSLKMKDGIKVQMLPDHFFVNTGSPHYIVEVNGLDNMDVYSKGKAIRESEPYKKDGVNVNFIEKQKDILFVRTFERGVENETLSCGTGVTAAALVNAINNGNKIGECKIKTLGGELKVSYKFENGIFHDIWLHGPAQHVYKGEIKI